jgi:N-methylhydantoinase A
VIRVADEQTIDALKLISVRRGYDPRDFTLVTFGGGGPTHASALLDELGARRIAVPPFPGAFSAWGMLMTEPRVDRVQTRILPLDTADLTELECYFAAAEAEAISTLTAQGISPESIPTPRRSLDMRYRGQEHTVDVAVEAKIVLDRARMTAAFHERHQRRYTFALQDTAVEIVNFRVTATASIARPTVGLTSPIRGGNPHKGVRLVHFGHVQSSHHSEPMSTPVYDRERLPTGFASPGPLIVEEPSTTTVVQPGQHLNVDDAGNLIITLQPAV